MWGCDDGEVYVGVVRLVWWDKVRREVGKWMHRVREWVRG